MSSIPTKMITELWDRALANPGATVRTKAYTLRTDGVSTTLCHYGTPIYNRVAGDVDFGDAWSVSDRDAINSLFRLNGLDSVARIKDGRLMTDLEGIDPAFLP